MPCSERSTSRKRSRNCISCSFSMFVAIASAILSQHLTRTGAEFGTHPSLLPMVLAFSPNYLVSERRHFGHARIPVAYKAAANGGCTRSRLMAINLQDEVWLADEVFTLANNESQILSNRLGTEVTATKEHVDVRPRASFTAYSSPRTAGLSKFHQRILSSTIERQRFVTGRYPLVVTVEENPTRKWLGLGRGKTSSTSHVLVNGTSVDRSLASYDRFQWLDDAEREELHDHYVTVSLELLAEIHCKKPAYLNVLPTFGAGSTAAARRAADASPSWDRWKRNSVLFEKLEETIWQETKGDRLWATGFSLTKRQGDVYSVDAESGHMENVNSRTEKSMVWPNEVNSVPLQQYVPQPKHGETQGEKERRRKKDELEDALLISDGFLVPGRDNGGLRIVRNPGSSESEWSVSLTGDEAENEGWFYHRATWVDLTGDGRKSILTARAKRPSILNNGRSDRTVSSTKTQLVWLERPEPFRIDEATGTPLEKDGTVFDPFGTLHIPWKVRVLDEGPDVMFCVADLDTEDDTVEVLASQFFSRNLSLHSIKRGQEPHVTFRRTIDDKCGAAFSAILANLDNSFAQNDHTRTVVDSGSTVATLQQGEVFSHLLVTSHECSVSETEGSSALYDSAETSAGTENIDGGSLFAYRVPSGKDAWKSKPWLRTVVSSGFRVRPQLSNAINPGAPGFCYAFYPKKDGATTTGDAWKRPLIAVAGDCAESAYLYRPINSAQKTNIGTASPTDPSARYALMCELQCGATVGSIGIGYDDFCEAEQESGYAKIYVPCYEKDKIFVFAMGSGEDDCDADSGW